MLVLCIDIQEPFLRQTNYSLGQVRQIIKRLKLQFYQGMKTHRHIFTEVSVWEFHRKAREILEKAAQAWVR